MAQDVFLQNGGKQNAPIFGQHTHFSIRTQWKLNKTYASMVKFQNFPTTGMQEKYLFHAFDR